MSMKVIMPANSRTTEEQLAFIREMGIEHLELNVKLEEANVETVTKIQERFAKFGHQIVILSCNPLQKNPLINLGKEGRDGEIEKFNRFVRTAAKTGVPAVSVAWQPNGIFRSGRDVRPMTRGGVSAYADMKTISAGPVLNDRVYTEEEIWDNFKYFLERVIPVCEAEGVRMALHPNDPPVPSLGGVASLIYNTECYRKAFAMADSPALGMKMCIGCWLEGGEVFGNLLEDIEAFAKEDRIVCVHFRNVSGTIPYFEETLSEDGYANMYAIMKQLVACGYEGPISIDHAFKGYESTGGMIGSFAYPTGHMKGPMHAAEIELGKREH